MRLDQKKKCLEKIDDYGYLDYGKIIPKDVLEEIFDVKFESGWEFLGPYLSLKEFLEENGYLCTSENLAPGCLKIFDADEIALRADSIMKNLVRRMKKLQSCMVNTKIHEFDNDLYKKHLHASNKVSVGLHALSSSLSHI